MEYNCSLGSFSGTTFVKMSTLYARVNVNHVGAPQADQGNSNRENVYLSESPNAISFHYQNTPKTFIFLPFVVSACCHMMGVQGWIGRIHIDRCITCKRVCIKTFLTLHQNFDLMRLMTFDTALKSCVKMRKLIRYNIQISDTVDDGSN